MAPVTMGQARDALASLWSLRQMTNGKPRLRIETMDGTTIVARVPIPMLEPEGFAFVGYVYRPGKHAPNYSITFMFFEMDGGAVGVEGDGVDPCGPVVRLTPEGTVRPRTRTKPHPPLHLAASDGQPVTRNRTRRAKDP